MCGRYGLVLSGQDIEGAFDVSLDPSWIFPRYNVAPGQEVLAITNDRERRAEMLWWGLIPEGTKDPKGGKKPINARGETVAEKWPFGMAFARRRCLVVADSYYEWRKGGKTRIPHRVRLKSGQPFALAGLWETWRSPDGHEVRTCCIVTTLPNDLIALIHDRMPVMLSQDAQSMWLERAATSADLRELLVPYPAGDMEAYEIPPMINNWRNDTPAVIEPVARLPL